MADNNDLQYRLYLSQGEENIYIDNCKIPTHHIEGIRFLYRQFRRNRLGVIMNDPYGNGRYIQIVLFLKAIRSLLNKPVLILCSDEAENEWMDQFFTWTDYYDEIAVGTATPVMQKLIVINTMLNMPVYCGMEWSIIIVDGDKNNSINQLLQMPFIADFKIWSTAVNMKLATKVVHYTKEIIQAPYIFGPFLKVPKVYKFSVAAWRLDLSMATGSPPITCEMWVHNGTPLPNPSEIQKHLYKFAEIFKWIYPMEDFDVLHFMSNTDDPVDVWENSIFLDSFMEDIVIRRDDISSSFEKYQRDFIMPAPKPVTATDINKNVSRKNKDATGTKIKRMKTVANVNVTEQSNKPSVTNVTGEGTWPATVTDIYKSIKNKDATGTKIKRLKTKADDVNVTETGNKSSVTNVTREETRPGVTQESLAIILASILGESSKTSEFINKDIGATPQNEKESQCDKVQTDDSDTQSARQLYYELENLTQNAGTKPEEIDTQPYRKGTLISKSHSGEEPNKAFSSSTSNDQDNIYISDEMLKDKPGNDQTIDELNPDIQSKNCSSCKYMSIIPLPSDKNEKHLTNVNDEANKTTNNSMKMVKMVAKTHGDNVTTPMELDGDKNSEQVSSLKRNTDNIEDRMKEYEEKLRKKFRGSFLDNLF